MNLIGTLEVGEEYGVCPLLFRGRSLTCKMTPICKQASTSKPALPTNHPFYGMDGALLQATSHNISPDHPFIKMGGDALRLI